MAIKDIRDLEKQKFNDKGQVRVSNDTEPVSLLYAEQSSTVSYIGEGLFGALTSEPKWRISKVDISSGVSIKYASPNFDQVWDDRETLTYS